MTYLVRLLIIATVFSPLQTLHANGPWNGKPAAVVLTYDDGLNVHLDTVVPLLNKHNLKATFYVTGTAGSVGKRPKDWKRAASAGHELGNHTMIHPCSAGLPGRDWVKPDKDLDQYTYDKFLQEITTANRVLGAIDNNRRRTFAYTCGDKKAGEVSIVEAVKDQTVAARGVDGGINRPGQINLFNLLAYSVSGQRFEALQAEADKALQNNGLLIVLFHGVGGEHGLNIERKEHQKFIEYLSSRQDEFWVATLLDVADYINENDL